MRLLQLTIIMLTIACLACAHRAVRAGGVSVEVPSSWTLMPHEARAKHPGLAFQAACHPEPLPRLNTTVWIYTVDTAPVGGGGNLFDMMLKRASTSYSELVLKTPVSESNTYAPGGHFVELAFRFPSPLTGEPVAGNDRWWVFRSGWHETLVQVQAPDPFDPECSKQLEALLASITIR